MSLSQKNHDELVQLIEEINPLVYIVEVALHRSKFSTLRILIDTDFGIKLDEVREISRKVSRHLEEHPDFQFRYHLEVSSPGLDRPLKLKRQYKRHLGRNLRLTMLEGEQYKGKLVEVQEDTIVLEPEIKKKKKKDQAGNESGPLTIAYSDIKEAKVLVSFK